MSFETLDAADRKEAEDKLKSRDYTKQHDYKFLVDENKKQTIMSPKRFNTIIEEVKARKITNEDSKFRRNWLRNKSLIDLECIPKDKKKGVLLSLRILVLKCGKVRAP